MSLPNTTDPVKHEQSLHKQTTAALIAQTFATDSAVWLGGYAAYKANDDGDHAAWDPCLWTDTSDGVQAG